MNTLLSFFLNSKVKLLILAVVLISLFAWHKVIVHEAVTEAVAEVELQTQREKFKLLDKANNESIRLKEQIAKNKQEKDRELQIANSKYNNLLAWVRNLPSQTSGGSSTGNPGDSEAGREEVIAELRRRHAADLAKYSFDAEEVKIALQQCYRDYDAVKKARDGFIEENTLKTN